MKKDKINVVNTMNITQAYAELLSICNYLEYALKTNTDLRKSLKFTYTNYNKLAILQLERLTLKINN